MLEMRPNPRIYEINTRVWIKKFGEHAVLADVPAEFWTDLAQKGFDAVWLMGIWKRCEDIIADCCFSPDLMQSYSNSLPDWKKEDVIGSPYSICSYEVSPHLGSQSDLKLLREKLNSLGMKLILDFVPNHFGASTGLIDSNPEIFLEGDDDLLGKDSFTFFRTGKEGKEILAHGRDPLFPAWTDTVQINYFCKAARMFMTDTLVKLAGMCDGIRCDMAMLALNNVFRNTWLGVIDKYNFPKPEKEFWQEAITSVKEKFPDFVFIAEAYWDLGWNLQQLGFDYTYDKRLLDRLYAADVPGLKAHLNADTDYQNKSVRFIENHDECRAASKLGKYRSLASAVIISTIRGMKLFYDGQFDGRKTRLPVQLGREPEEKLSSKIRHYYDTLLRTTKADIFRFGEWMMVEPITSGGNNTAFEDMFAWRWNYNDERMLVVINFSETKSCCRLKFDPMSSAENIVMTDLLTDEEYLRSSGEIRNIGLYIELKGFQSHIFSYRE